MAYPFLPVNPCCTDVVLNTPCGCSSTLPNTGCGQNPCETNVILSSNVLYNGPVLDCIIAEPCDTLNVILQKIDEIICNLLTQINTLNIQVTNITNQIININSEIININNTLDVCCAGATTTTTSTTLCPCTYYQYVSVAPFPGTFTYVECDTKEVVTVVATNVVDTVCVDNNYPTIEVGQINVLNTGVCCTFITTTTTTTAFIESFCNEVTAIGRVNLYWTDGNGDPQFVKLTSNTVYICAQVGSIAFNGTGSITVVGSGTPCIVDGECAPVTTTTTTTTEALPCTAYNLEATGPSSFSGDNDWEALECNTNITVSGTIIYPNIVNTGCIIDGSLLLGPKLLIVDSEPCPTTTTTTTIVNSCVAVTFIANSDCDDLGYAIVEYTDCNGVLQTVNITLFQDFTFCSLVGSPSPEYICGAGSFLLGGTCTAPTTTTTTSSSSTTTTTTTIAPCTEWTWESIGANVSDLEYTDCDGLPVVIPAIDITNNSGVICVYPNVTPNWDPSPTSGYHNISTFGINCSTTTTTTTLAPCTTWSWEAVGFNISGIEYTNCDGENVYIDVDDVTNNSGDICVYPNTTPVWSPVSPGGTHILDTLGDTCVTPPTTTTTTSYVGCRPQGLLTIEYFNSYDDGSGVVDYTASFLDACNACEYINSLPLGPSETSLFGQSATFAIGQTVYAGTGTSCNLLANGFYITDHATCQITEIEDGIIVDITYCSPTTTTTSSSTTTTTTTAAPYLKLTLDNNSSGTLLGACGFVFSADLNIYVENGIPVNGGFVYEDLALTIPFAGNDKCYKVELIDTSFMAVQVSNTGEILSSLTC